MPSTLLPRAAAAACAAACAAAAVAAPVRAQHAGATAPGVPAPGTSAPGTPAPGTPTYVAMGSSYAAGPGVGAPDSASRACARSRSNYAQLVARRRHLALVDVSCSGATTQDVLARSQAGFPPQIEAVDARTRLVTVTIGGNDVHYVGNLMGYTCRDAGNPGGACAVTPDARVEQEFAALPALLRRVIAAVHARAPAATVVLVGYLPVLPLDDVDTPGACPAVPLSPADADRVRAVAARLARVMDGVAAATHTPIVRAAALGAGHDACSADPYVAGFRPAANPGWSQPVPYHPNRAGMERLAAAIGEMLGTAPAVPLGTSAPAAFRAPPCGAGQVELRTAGRDGDFAGTSHDGTYLVLRNTGASACAVPGFPQITLSDAAGTVPATARTPGARGMHPGPVVPPAVLPPGATVAATMRWVSGPVFDRSVCRKPTTLALAVGGGAKRVPLAAQLCGDRAAGGIAYDVTRFQPDAIARPTPPS